MADFAQVVHGPGRALGYGKKLLEKYSWASFRPHSEWAEKESFAAGIPGEVRFIYQPRRGVYNWAGTVVKGIERDVPYHAYYFDPVRGRKHEAGAFSRTAAARKPLEGHIQSITSDEYRAPPVPSPQDWVLVLERIR